MTLDDITPVELRQLCRDYIAAQTRQAAQEVINEDDPWANWDGTIHITPQIVERILDADKEE